MGRTNRAPRLPFSCSLFDHIHDLLDADHCMSMDSVWTVVQQLTRMVAASERAGILHG